MSSSASEKRLPVKRVLLTGAGLAVVALAIISFRLTRDGELVTPRGQGTVELDAGTFEDFPLPDYAAEFITDNYKSYLVEVEPGIKVHVLEVGSGYPVYLQHGTPTSGFLYRQVAEQLPQDRFRIIMPTMVGLGFSSKVPASRHTLENHVTWMNEVLEQLAVDELIFVGHDWGGHIGMGALERSPDLIEGAVILNTVLTAPKDEIALALPVQLAKTPVVGELVFEGVTSIFDQMAGAQADPDSVPPDVRDLYARPVADSGNGKAPLATIRMTADSLDHPTAEQARTTEDYARSLDMPVEIVWGTNDPLLADRLGDMVKLFPKATVIKTGAGHFLQEEAEVPETIATSIKRVLDQIEGDGDQ